MNTGEDGNLTQALENIRRLRDQQLQHSNWNTKTSSILDWLEKFSVGKISQTIGVIFGLVLLTILLIICCVLPLIQIRIRRAMRTAMGQFVMLIQQQEKLPEKGELWELDEPWVRPYAPKRLNNNLYETMIDNTDVCENMADNINLYEPMKGNLEGEYEVV
ncbi:hypothetical protein ABVT39_012257 [Epinephelus coioides]